MNLLPRTVIIHIGLVGDQKFTVQMHATIAIRPGDVVEVQVVASKMHIFREQDGKTFRASEHI